MSEPMLALFYFKTDLPAGLASRIVECETGCWEWQGTRIEGGYGRAYWQGRKVLAHCLTYGLLIGPVAPGLLLDHLCRNPPCCNPAHLEAVTNLVNARRGRRTLRQLTAVRPETDPRSSLPRHPLGAGPWLPVPGWPDYMVSAPGAVWSRPRRTTRGGILRQNVDEIGRPYVNLTRDGRQKVRRVHQLVAEAFLGPCPSGQEVRHLDGNAGNCAIWNLAYGTHAENMADRIRHGTSRSRNPLCPQGHEYAPENTAFTSNGSRRCRACSRIGSLARYHARREARQARAA